MVGILAGALGRGIGQAAEATAHLAKDYIDDERKVNVYKEMSDVDVMKQDRIDELKTNRKYDDDIRRSDPTGSLATNERDNKKLTVTDIYNDKGVLAALKNKAIAEKAPESSYSIAQAELARDELNQRKETRSIMDKIDAAAASGDTKEVDRLTTRMNVLTGTKNGPRFDAKVVENENGTKGIFMYDRFTGAQIPMGQQTPVAPGQEKKPARRSLDTFNTRTSD